MATNFSPLIDTAQSFNYNLTAHLTLLRHFFKFLLKRKIY